MFRKLFISFVVLAFVAVLVPGTLAHAQVNTIVQVDALEYHPGDPILISWSIPDFNGVGTLQMYKADTYYPVLTYSVNFQSGTYVHITPSTPGTYFVYLSHKGNSYYSNMFQITYDYPSNQWAIGNWVTLCANTEVRFGPELGVDRSLTQNEWAQIKNRRYQLGYIWWDVVFPTGRTGWVRQDQADCRASQPGAYGYFYRDYLAGWSYPQYDGYAYVQVLIENLNLRSGPGTGYSIYGYATQHQYYRLVQTSGQWGNVQTPSGLSAWLYLSNGYTNFIFG